jgi:hypothetical protein
MGGAWFWGEGLVGGARPCRIPFGSCVGSGSLVWASIDVPRPVPFWARCLCSALLAVEPRARIHVRTAGPPVAPAFLAAPFHVAPRPLRLLRVIPQLAAREPLHDNVLVRALQLRKRRLQLLLLGRTKSRWLVVDQDRPVRIPRRHAAIVQSSGRSSIGANSSA